jgi:adenylate cyclase
MIQSCINTLALRHMVRPFGTAAAAAAAPMADIFAELAGQMAELRAFKQQQAIAPAPTGLMISS